MRIAVSPEERYMPFKTFFESPDMHQYTDAVIVSGKGASFPAHRLILGSSSPFLNELLQEIRQGEVCTIFLPDTSLPCIELLMALFYTGKVRCSEEHRVPFMELLQLLQMDRQNSVVVSKSQSKIKLQNEQQAKMVTTFSDLRKQGISPDTTCRSVSPRDKDNGIALVDGCTEGLISTTMIGTNSTAVAEDTAPMFEDNKDGIKRRLLASMNHQCTQCSFIGISSEQLSNHRIRQHAKKKTVKCKQCSRRFSTNFELRRHVANQHAVVELPSIGGFIAGSKTTEPNTTNELNSYSHRWKCDICDKAFRSAGSLKFHRLSHSRKPRSKPEVPILTNLDKLPFECLFCPKSFLFPSSRTKHTRAIHLTKKCDLCKNVFLSSDAELDMHFLDVHIPGKANMPPSEPPKLERMEPLPVKKRKRVKKVIAGHTSDTNQTFPCKKCPFVASTVSRLNFHNFSHSGDRTSPHKCVVCLLACSTKVVLNRHLLCHSMDRPFECELCLLRFGRKDYLTTHLIGRHTHKFPYRCSICNAGFMRPSMLEDHVKRFHKNQPECVSGVAAPSADVKVSSKKLK